MFWPPEEQQCGNALKFYSSVRLDIPDWCNQDRDEIGWLTQHGQSREKNKVHRRSTHGSVSIINVWRKASLNGE